MEERRFGPDKMDLLDMPARRQALPPDKLLNLLSIGKYVTILDVGAGTGYFSIPAAQMTEGTVYALDPEQDMLDVLLTRAREQRLSNIHAIQGVVENIPLPEGAVNIVIASLVLHLVDSLPAGLREIQRVLNDGGYLLCLEWETKESPLGPSLDIRISSSDMEKAIKEAGLSIVKKVFPINFLYVIVAKK